MTETKFSKVRIFSSLLRNVPLLLLLISVLNEFDFNYLEVTLFSFNFLRTFTTSFFEYSLVFVNLAYSSLSLHNKSFHLFKLIYLV